LDEIFVEFAKLLQIDGFSLRGHRVVVGKFVASKRLMDFFVRLEPLARLGHVHRLELLDHGLIERLLVFRSEGA